MTLEQLYQKMSDLTEPECAKCMIPHGCCDAMYCGITMSWAKERWGVELKPTGHPKLPFMGYDGCTVAPHLRPMCTLHTCEVSSMGYKSGDKEWTDEYFSLRDQINEMEGEKGVPNA